MAKFNFKKGDTVEIIAGDDKGTKATVLSVMPKKR
jgi:large subunit ribosomal protein L24